MSANLQPDNYSSLREQMVEKQLRARGIRDQRVLAAMSRVPRHLFVPQESVHLAYEDQPVSIGAGQTVSQPYMVAAMLEAAEIQPADIVLEVGTGSGYEAAVLAELAAEIFSIERIPALAESAQGLLARLNYSNVVLATGDGSEGLRQYAPYDAIIVAAAAPAIPAALTEQLRSGGRAVIPVGDEEEQELQVLRRGPEGAAVDRRFKCKFVPLLGRHGFTPRP